MRSRKLLGVVAGAAVAAISVSAAAQQATKLPRIGWLQNNASTFPAYEGFRAGLKELGYADGQNVVIEVRQAKGDLDRLPELASELARLPVDVLYVAADQGLRAAKQATTTIPIVVLACDPLDSLVVSLARPGGSATGLTCISSDLAGKRLELLKELVPGLTHVAVLFNPNDPNKIPEYSQMRDAGSRLNLTVQSFHTTYPSQFDAAFAGMVASKAQALVILADALMNFHAKAIADLAVSNGLPAIYGFREFPEAGGLVSFGTSLREEHRHAARYIDKILKGAKPGDLPVEQPTTFELVVNLKTAKALGLDVSPMLLSRADKVIE
jgi:putative ABC transport system substrate-binding protein